MRRFLPACLVLLAALLPAIATAATACPGHYALGQPPVIVKESLKARTKELCFRAFAVMHSGVSRTPLWAAEHLVRDNIRDAEALTRRDSFHAEERLPAADRAELSDYARSGFDRGHLAPNGDMPDPESQAESFSLANMVPQVHTNNAGVWAGIESAVRQLAVREGEVYVVSGPAFIGGDIQSLQGRVLVPTHLWKAVYSPQRQQAGAYLITNDETTTYSTLSIAELERMVGIRVLPGVEPRVREAAMELPAPRQRRTRSPGEAPPKRAERAEREAPPATGFEGLLQRAREWLRGLGR